MKANSRRTKTPTVSAKRFKQGDRLPVQAQRIWQILTAFVMFAPHGSRPRKVMPYGDLAVLMGYADRRAGHMLGRQLGIVGHFCVANDLPPLNTIVINEATGMPGDEVVVRPGRTVKEEQKAVASQDWFEIRPPTTGTLRQIYETY